MWKHTAVFALFLSPLAFSQAQPAAPPPLPTFEVATIKPSSPAGLRILGFSSQPGGHVSIGNSSVITILDFAFDLRNFQIDGGPDWARSEKFDIVAVPPDSSPSRTAPQPLHGATPTLEQRQMLQSLLRDRFNLQYHWEKHDHDVYILTRGKKPLQLKTPEHPDADPRGGVMMKGGGIADGEAFGTNITMSFLATQLSRSLGLPVLDQTGLEGHYDFHVDPFDSDNHDIAAAVFGAMDHLGLKLTRSTASIDTLVIDHVDHPSAN